MNKMKIHTANQKPDCTLKILQKFFTSSLPHSGLMMLYPEETMAQEPSQSPRKQAHNLLQRQQQDSLTGLFKTESTWAHQPSRISTDPVLNSIHHRLQWGFSLCLQQALRPAFHNFSVLAFPKLLTFFSVSSCNFNGTSYLQYFPSFKLNCALENECCCFHHNRWEEDNFHMITLSFSF